MNRATRMEGTWAPLCSDSPDRQTMYETRPNHPQTKKMLLAQKSSLDVRVICNNHVATVCVMQVALMDLFDKRKVAEKLQRTL